MTELEKLAEYVKSADQDITQCEIDTESFSGEVKPLAELIAHCMSDVREVYRFTSSIADGDLSVKAPDRHNYFAGPVKDLFYKLKHLTWQAKEVAKGDYSQRVDFLGSFSESFNFMITELEKRENEIKKNAENEVQLMELQNMRLKRQLDRQIFHYSAYRDFIHSFIEFRNHYKRMMGEVYTLFNEQRFEEGRLLVAKINDLMGSEVVISKDYSNNEYLNAVMTDIAGACRLKNAAFEGKVYVPDGFINTPSAVDSLIDCSELIFMLLDTKTHSRQSLDIAGGVKNGWFSLAAKYSAAAGDFPGKLEQCVNPECMFLMEKIRTEAENCGDIFSVDYRPACRAVELTLHLRPHNPDGSAMQVSCEDF